MAHGDDQGLRLPPVMAPIQTVIVPIWRKEGERASVMELAERVNGLLSAAGIRTKLDTREDQTPGFKFNDWEMRGVPVRVEIGPRDVQQNAVVLARRDRPGKEGKEFGVPVEGVAARVSALFGRDPGRAAAPGHRIPRGQHPLGLFVRRTQADSRRARRIHQGLLGRQSRR